MLAELGYPVTVDGAFGAETTRAVSRWYSDHGYAAPTRPRDEAGPASTAATPAPTAPAVAVPSEDAYVPAREIVGVPVASARVLQGVSVGAQVGVGGVSDLVLGSTDIVVSVTASAAEADGIVDGQSATISYGGTEIPGTIGGFSRIASPAGAGQDMPDDGPQGAGEPGGPSEQATFVVIPDSPLPEGTGIGSARITVVTEIVASDALLVPVLAVVDRGTDGVILRKRQGDGTLAEVAARVVATLDGAVAVEPREPGALRAGDDVQVG